MNFNDFNVEENGRDVIKIADSQSSHYLDQSESDGPDEKLSIDNLKNLKSKYDLNFASSKINVEVSHFAKKAGLKGQKKESLTRNYSKKKMSLHDFGYGTDSGDEKDTKEKDTDLVVQGSKGDTSPMKNPYLKSIEAISKFKIKTKIGKRVKL